MTNGISNEEVGGRLRRAAWGLVLLGPVGALIGGAMNSNPLDRREEGEWKERGLRRDRRVFIALCVLGLAIALGSAFA